MKEPSLADIKAFVATAKLGSFTQAAEQLSCSRSHVSKQLSQLELDLGVKLISRTTRSQNLTVQGQVFFEQCQHSLNGIEQAIEQVMDSSSSIRGQININCVGGFIGEEIIAPLINDFIKLFPQVNIHLDFTSQRVDLVSGEFDMVFRMGRLDDSELIARQLTTLSIVTVASPSYLNKFGFPKDPFSLKHHQCITGTVKTWSYQYKDDDSRKVEVKVAGGISCKNGRVMLKTALQGHGIIRVPSLYCKPELIAGSLIPVFDDWHVPETPLTLVYLKDKYQPERLKAFIEFVRENIHRYIED